MLRGILSGGVVVVTPDGKQIVETAEPALQLGYVARQTWAESDSAITQMWDVVPESGTEQEATVALARIQALSLSDEDALLVPALYGEWDEGVEYRKGDRRTYQGPLYKYIGEKPTVSTPEWNPRDAHSLWVQVKPQQPGEATEWEQRQPGVTEGYAKGDLVVNPADGKTYRSTKDDNYDVPGQPNTAWELAQ